MGGVSDFYPLPLPMPDPVSWEPHAPASGGGVTSVSAASPLASSGGTTPSISLTGVIPVANGGTGVATAGASYAFIGPAGSSGAPSFRALTAADLPASVLSASYLFVSPIEVQCAAAMERIAHYINRAAGQHGHHIRVVFAVLRVQMGVV